MSRAFLDSNVLVYAFSDGDAKQAAALALLLAGGAISVQCLNEFASVTLRKLKLDWPRVEQGLDGIRELCKPVVPITVDLHRMGLAIAKDYRLNPYDGLIVAAAITADCDVLYSEDMHAGLVVDGRLTVTNPFTG